MSTARSGYQRYGTDDTEGAAGHHRRGNAALVIAIIALLLGIASMFVGTFVSPPHDNKRMDGLQARIADLEAQLAALVPGDVFGPASSVSGNLASYNGTSGKHIVDSGIHVNDFALSMEMANASYQGLNTTVHNNEGTCADGNFVLCDGATGRLIRNSGYNVTNFPTLYTADGSVGPADRYVGIGYYLKFFDDIDDVSYLEFRAYDDTINAYADNKLQLLAGTQGILGVAITLYSGSLCQCRDACNPVVGEHSVSVTNDHHPPHQRNWAFDPHAMCHHKPTERRRAHLQQ